MIQYIENGLDYIRRDGTFTEVGKEVSKEEYERLRAMERSEVKKMVEEETPSWVFQGYGFYGHRLVEEEGRFYVCRVQGSSCD